MDDHMDDSNNESGARAVVGVALVFVLYGWLKTEPGSFGLTLLAVAPAIGWLIHFKKIFHLVFNSNESIWKELTVTEYRSIRRFWFLLLITTPLAFWTYPAAHHAREIAIAGTEWVLTGLAPTVLKVFAVRRILNTRAG